MAVPRDGGYDRRLLRTWLQPTEQSWIATRSVASTLVTLVSGTRGSGDELELE